MFVVRQTGQWICRTCRRDIFSRSNHKRLFWTTLSPWQNVEGVPPGLILRARKMALQHQELEQRAASMTEYTPQSVQLYRRISELADVSANLKAFEDAHTNIEELKRIISTSSDKEMISLANDELQQTTIDLEDLKEKLISSLIPRHPHAHLPCLMEFKRGVGGDDAAIFAADLFKMYQKYANAKGWTWEVLSYNTADGFDNAIIEAVVSVSSPQGDDVYGTLRNEAGVHRVQRIPITENQGRVHTSAAAIMIFPQIEKEGDVESVDDILNMEDVRVDVMRARGAGGQHVNRTESAVRMTHIPTGITVSMQDSRSQHANRAAAIMILRSRLAAKREEERKEEARKVRNMQVTSNDRSDKMRTWNFNQNRVTDHRGFKYNDLRGCMEGGALQELLDGVAKVVQQMELEEAIAMDADQLPPMGS